MALECAQAGRGRQHGARQRHESRAEHRALRLAVSGAEFTAALPRLGTNWRSIVDHTDGGLLAEATLWASTSQQAENQAFNVNNGDLWRWCELWPRIADWFELPSAPPVRLSFHQLFVDYRAQWRELAGQDLVEADILRLNDGTFADFVFSWNYDMFGDGSKLRRAGFTDMQATDDMFFRLFAQLRAARVIP